MKSQNPSLNNHSDGEMLEKYIADNLPHFFPKFKLIEKNARVANNTFAIHAKAQNNIDYFIEIKTSKCNRLSIGQIVESKASLSKVNPDAKIIFICKEIKPELKETLRKIDVNVETFADLGIAQSDIVKYQNLKTAEIKLSPVEQNAYFALLRQGISIAKAEDIKATLDVSYV